MNSCQQNYRKRALEEEAAAFDAQIIERVQAGFVPDLRRLKRVEWFYNNVWRDPFFVELYLMPKINYVIDIANQVKGRVLEVGCGCGYLSLEMARNGLMVTGVDLSPESIRVAQQTADDNAFKKGFGTLDYLCCDIMSLDFEPQCFESVVFFSSFHHMADPLPVLEKIYHCLKPGGNLVMVEPVRGEFTMPSARIAALLRFVLPTHMSFREKKAQLVDQTWENLVQDTFDDYAFRGEHEQSPHDNLVSTSREVIAAVSSFFYIKDVFYSGAFVEKIIGSLRGESKSELAALLLTLDQKLVQEKVLPPTNIRLHAIKEK